MVFKKSNIMDWISNILYISGNLHTLMTLILNINYCSVGTKKIHLHLCSGLRTVGIFRVGSSKKRVRQVIMQLASFIALKCKFLPLHFNELYQL